MRSKLSLITALAAGLSVSAFDTHRPVSGQEQDRPAQSGADKRRAKRKAQKIARRKNRGKS